MSRALYTVSFLNTEGAHHVSRFFSTVAAARKWAAWLLTANYVAEVSIFRGPAGGDLLERKGRA